MATCYKDNLNDDKVAKMLKEVVERLSELVVERYNEYQHMRDMIDLWSSYVLHENGMSNSDRTDLYANRCECYIIAKQYERALEDADKVIELRPDWWRGYALKSRVHLYNKDYGKYQEFHQRARSISEDSESTDKLFKQINNRIKDLHNELDKLIGDK